MGTVGPTSRAGAVPLLPPVPLPMRFLNHQLMVLIGCRKTRRSGGTGGRAPCQGVWGVSPQIQETRPRAVRPPNDVRRGRGGEGLLQQPVQPPGCFPSKADAMRAGRQLHRFMPQPSGWGRALVPIARSCHASRSTSSPGGRLAHSSCSGSSSRSLIRPTRLSSSSYFVFARPTCVPSTSNSSRNRPNSLPRRAR